MRISVRMKLEKSLILNPFFYFTNDYTQFINKIINKNFDYDSLDREHFHK